MASTAVSETMAQEETTTAPRDITNAHRSQDEIQSSTPLEMTSLSIKPQHIPETTQSEPVATAPIPSASDPAPETTSVAAPQIYSSLHPASPDIPSKGPMIRQQSTAIGPSSDVSIPLPPSKDEDKVGPTLLITLLLTNGARHPFRLDAKYLQKREVKVRDNDPFNLSVYKLKELILREWRDEWEAKPASPSYIRLISFGKLLDDKGVIKDSKFNHDASNVVHMTIKPQDYVEEEDTKGSKAGLSGGREGHERSPGCRCVVM